MMPTLRSDHVRDVAERAEEHPAVERLARAGLAARTVVWTVVGLLALSLATGGSQQADQSGALRELAERPLGAVLLTAMSLGFLIYSAYRVLCGVVGHRSHRSAAKRWLHRTKSLGEAAVYVGAAVSSGRVVLGDRPDSEEQTQSVTATVMGLPGGRTLVGLAGATAVVVAVVLLVRACRHEHEERLETDRMPRWLVTPALWLGTAGLSGRSVAIVLVGGFLVNAALRFDPDEAKGLDATLQTLREQPFGPYLLLLAALGLLCYALWSLMETIYRDV
jgi:hypothetical protein